jgi:YVTN family beta-propeller protein
MGKHSRRQRREPYAWLGAGAIAAGLWAGMAGPTAVAHADGASNESGSNSTTAGGEAGDTKTSTAGATNAADTGSSRPKSNATAGTKRSNGKPGANGASGQSGSSGRSSGGDAATNSPPPDGAADDAGSPSNNTASDGLSADPSLTVTADESRGTTDVARVSATKPVAPGTVEPSTVNTSSAESLSAAQPAITAAAPAPADPTAPQVVDTIPLGQRAGFESFLSQDGRRLFVLTASPNVDPTSADPAITVIDTTTNRVIAGPTPTGGSELPISFNSTGTTLTPDGSRLYSVSPNEDVVNVYNTATNTSSQVSVPRAPVAVISSPDGRSVYVTNSDNTISVIDTATNTVVGTPIAAGTPTFNPTAALSPDGRFLYVTNWAEQSVYVIDTTTKSVVGQPIKVGDANAYNLPLSVKVAPGGGRLYVNTLSIDTANLGNYRSRVTAIDTASGTVVGQPIDLGTNAIGGFGYVYNSSTISPDGSRLYLNSVDARQGPDGQPVYTTTITSIDTNSWAPIGAPITLNGLALGLLISADGRRLYAPRDVINYASLPDSTSSLTVIDTASNAVVYDVPLPGVIPGAPDPGALSADGSRLYLSTVQLDATGTSGVGAVTVIDTKTVLDPVAARKAAAQAAADLAKKQAAAQAQVLKQQADAAKEAARLAAEAAKQAAQTKVDAGNQKALTAKVNNFVKATNTGKPIAAPDGSLPGECVSLIKQYLRQVYGISAGKWGDAIDYQAGVSAASSWPPGVSPGTRTRISKMATSSSGGRTPRRRQAPPVTSVSGLTARCMTRTTPAIHPLGPRTTRRSSPAATWVTGARVSGSARCLCATAPTAPSSRRSLRAAAAARRCCAPRRRHRAPRNRRTIARCRR